MHSVALTAFGIGFWAFLTIAAVAGIVSDYKRRQVELEPLRAAIERGTHASTPSAAACPGPGHRRARRVTTPSPGGQLGAAHETIVIALAMRGDQHAFDELVRRRQAWLRNFLRRLCRDPALADDLAQQSLLRAWRSMSALKSAAAESLLRLRRMAR